MIDDKCCILMNLIILLRALYHKNLKLKIPNSLKKGTLTAIAVNIMGYWKLAYGISFFLCLFCSTSFFAVVQYKNFQETRKNSGSSVSHKLGDNSKESPCSSL